GRAGATGGTGWGRRLAVGLGGLFGLPDSPSVPLGGSPISDNLAIGGGGGAGGNGGNGSGGGGFIGTGASLGVTASTITGNHANGGDRGVGGGGGGGGGGGVHWSWALSVVEVIGVDQTSAPRRQDER